MSLKMLRGALLALPLLLAACGGAKSENTGGATPSKADVDAAMESDMTLGSPDAPVTLIEYASVTCSACASFHEFAMPEIKEKYIDTGKVRLVFRESPTYPQQLAVTGSVIARCASERGGPDAYFAIIALLLKNQRVWTDAANTQAELTRIAAQADMDEAALRACLGRQDLIDLVYKNSEIGATSHNVRGTPTFVIDGETVTLRTIEDLHKAIDEAVAKKSS